MEWDGIEKPESSLLATESEREGRGVSPEIPGGAKHNEFIKRAKEHRPTFRNHVIWLHIRTSIDSIKHHLGDYLFVFLTEAARLPLFGLGVLRYSFIRVSMQCTVAGVTFFTFFPISHNHDAKVALNVTRPLFDAVDLAETSPKPRICRCSKSSLKISQKRRRSPHPDERVGTILSFAFK